MSADDNWRHRSLNMLCASCMFFVEKRGADFEQPAPVDAARVLGRCRRHAPTLGGWPAVYTGDWCGDHKIDETKQ